MYNLPSSVLIEPYCLKMAITVISKGLYQLWSVRTFTFIDSLSLCLSKFTNSKKDYSY